MHILRLEIDYYSQKKVKLAIDNSESSRGSMSQEKLNSI